MFFPFQDPDRFRKQLDLFFGNDFWQKFEPYFQASNTQFNLYENDDKIIVLLSIPGITNFDEVEFNLLDQTLKVKGNLAMEYDGYVLKEEGLFQGTFERTLVIPEPVRQNIFEKKYVNGLIEITLFKLESKPPQTFVYTESTTHNNF